MSGARDLAELEADHHALRHAVGAVELARDVISATGPDTLDFLQGQVSQDVAALAVGGSAWTLLLQPQGKVDAWMRVSRTGDDAVVIDVEAGFGEAVAARLNRFKLRTRCEVTALDGWRSIALRGPGTAGVDVAATGAAVAAEVAWPNVAGVDLLGPAIELAPEIRRCGLDAYEALRIEAGVPALGHELDASTIPAEAGEWLITTSVSFTKGCYTGQELVARVDSRGSNTPRRLRGLVLAGDAAVPPVGAQVVVGGAAAGTLSSAAYSPARGAPVGLANLKRAVEPPAQATVCWDGGEVPATVEALPLV
jgi:folate-binding protein YgfZ